MIIYTDITDHFPIVHVDCSSKYNKPVKDSVQRNLSERKKQAFREALATLDWKEIYDENDAQGAFSSFHSIVLKLYNKHFPKRKIKTTYTTRKQWLSQGLKESIKIKNKLFRKYRKIDSVENETKYNIYRNKLNHLLKQAEKKHYSDLLEANKDSMKKTWQIMKNIVNKNKTKQLQTKFKLTDGSFTTDDFVISSKFNDFFVNI